MWTQALASVRNRSQASAVRRTCVGLAGETTIVAKRRTVVTFYASCLKSVNSHRDPGGRSRETQHCRHFWTRLGSSRLKSVNSHGSGGSWSRNAALSSLLDASRFFVSEKCQQSRIGGVLVAKRSTVVTFGRVSFLRVSKVSTVTDRGGPGRETQHCRHFWTRLVSSCLKNVNSHKVPGGSWSRNAELSSLLDSSRFFVSQKCQQSQGSGGVLVAKRRTVVTFELVSGLCVSKMSTVTGIGGAVVAKRRTVVTFGLVSGLRVSKVSTVTGIGGVLVAKRRTVVTFGPASGESRGERRKEKREIRGEKRDERRERKGERRDKREERREERRDRREERGERREERREERKEERGKRREARGEETRKRREWRGGRIEEGRERGEEREVTR